MNELVGLVAGVLELPPGAVDDDTGAATEAAWSSLRHVEIVVAVQRAYRVHLTPREARSCRSVGALCEVLTEKGIAA